MNVYKNNSFLVNISELNHLFNFFVCYNNQILSVKMLMKIVIIKVSFQLLILCIRINILNTFQLDLICYCLRILFFYAKKYI